ncbi:DA1-related 5 [Spatholobus suberectus]|nr:DA1-related 5 [Spatholobus suberectus]
MADLPSGGAVGAGMGELLKAALAILNKGLEFKPTLKRSKETLNFLAPEVEKMKQLNNTLDRPKGEIEKLETLIRDGQKLVDKYSKISRWRFPCFPCYQGRLGDNDKAIQRQLAMNVPVQNRNDLMEILINVRNILEILLSEQIFGHQLTEGVCGAPEEPKCIRMDEPLNKLKTNLLKEGVSVLGLTGLGGSGKTTLAKKICWDPQIKVVAEYKVEFRVTSGRLILLPFHFII